MAKKAQSTKKSQDPTKEKPAPAPSISIEQHEPTTPNDQEKKDPEVSEVSENSLPYFSDNPPSIQAPPRPPRPPHVEP